MDEWKEVPLGSLCDIYDGPHATPRKQETGNIFLGISSLGYDGRIDPAHFEYVSDEDFARWTRRITPQPNDIVFSYETKLGVAAILPDGFKCCLGRRMGLLRVKEGVDPRVLLYAYLAPGFQGTIHERTYHGSTVDRIPLKDLAGFPVLWPPEDEQRAIASVLSSLDAKIDLLHRQNKTLEAMAEALFRQWFVEEAEEGWEEFGLLDLVQLVPGGTPKTKEASYWDGDIMWISVREISENHKGFVNYAYKYITEEGLQNSAANLLPKYGTVISARGTVGKVGLLARPMAYSQSNFGVLPKGSSNFFFTFLLVHHSIDELHSNSYGAVFDTITTQSFQTIRHRLPGSEVINHFEALVTPMFAKMFNNTEQITTLTKLRDTLLPKLMSGEVRVETVQN